MENISLNRRSLLASATAAGAMTWLGQSSVLGRLIGDPKQGLVILFQGDSITDAGRNRNNPVANEGLGEGYPQHVASALHEAYPDLGLKIHNRGISGNKVPDLDRRWQVDCIDLQPDVVSILIGVNDIWHALNGNYDGTADSYRDGYAALLKRTREALPNTKLVICEPFVLMSGTVKQNQEKWFPEFDRRRAIAKEVAMQAEASWVPFQTMFDDAVAAGTRPEELAGDGVHPTQAGHALMAKTWRDVVGI